MVSINNCPFVYLKVASFVVVGVKDGEEDGVGDTLLIIFLFVVRRELSFAFMFKLIL